MLPGIILIIGLGLLLWRSYARNGTRENNRAQIFYGPIGDIVNLVILGVGVSLVVATFLM